MSLAALLLGWEVGRQAKDPSYLSAGLCLGWSCDGGRDHGTALTLCGSRCRAVVYWEMNEQQFEFIKSTQNDDLFFSYFYLGNVTWIIFHFHLWMDMMLCVRTFLWSKIFYYTHTPTLQSEPPHIHIGINSTSISTSTSGGWRKTENILYPFSLLKFTSIYDLVLLLPLLFTCPFHSYQEACTDYNSVVWINSFVSIAWRGESNRNDKCRD